MGTESCSDGHFNGTTVYVKDVLLFWVLGFRKESVFMGSVK